MSPDPVLVLRRRFPGLVFWFGRRTGVWWALVPPPAGWRLIEAADPEQLTRAVIESQSWPWPAPWRGARWTRGHGRKTTNVAGQYPVMREMTHDLIARQLHGGQTMAQE